MNSCFLITRQSPPTPSIGGGNAGNENRLIVRRSAAIGDSIAGSVVAERLIEQGHPVQYQSHRDIHCALRRMPKLQSFAEPSGYAHVNLDGAYERRSDRRVRHFHEMFFQQADQQLRQMGIALGKPINCKPKMRLRATEREIGLARFSDYPRPWVFICPRSESYAVRQVPDGIWQSAAMKIKGTVFWIGLHPAPPGIVDLQCRHLDNLIVWLGVADLLVSVDTGPVHIAAALGVPVVSIGQSSFTDFHLNDQNDYVTVKPDLPCLHCMENLCPKNRELPPCQAVDPEMIAEAVNARLDAYSGDKVSAVISIYRPSDQQLNHCLEMVLPQVSEVVIVVDLAGKIPEGARRDPKIRYLTKPLRDIGYGRKMNFAARHSNGRYLLQINDDCYVQADTVQKMLDVMKPGVGKVGILLYYPDGRIQHGGKFRRPGSFGWEHYDRGGYHPTIKEPTEMENVTGACVLVRREAFFAADGFDERFYLSCDDDDQCMKIRQAGYKIIYTPLTSAVHEESQSTKLTPDYIGTVRDSCRMLEEKWRFYWQYNRDIPIGRFP